MKHRILIGVALMLAAVSLTLFAVAPSKLFNAARAPEIDGDLDEWLAKSEREANAKEALIPETGKRIRWYQGRKNSKTRYSVIYLHGFSATRQEIAPVGELIADGLEANLFETRLAGHGHQDNPLQGVHAEDWLEDAAEALSIGAEIGEQIIIMGTSTGATLALAMTGHPSFEPVSTIVLLSPNFAPRDVNAEFLTWPGGPQLAEMVAGKTRSWEPKNELQALYWSTTYPMAAAVEMMRLVQYVRGKLPMRLQQSLLTIYSPKDTVVDTGRIVEAFGQMDSPRKQLVAIPGSGDSSNHVLAGDILAPENNLAIADQIIAFIRLDTGVADRVSYSSE